MTPEEKIASSIWLDSENINKIIDHELTVSIAKAITQAKREAYEEAAKIADHLIESVVPEVLKNAPGIMIAASTIADAIRKLARGEK